MQKVGFEQAAIKVEKEQEFRALEKSIAWVFGPDSVERFLKKVQKAGLRVRDLDLVIARGILEDVDEELAKSGKTGQALYRELTVSDQGQLREFYLSRVEQVAPESRAKFQKVYRYY